MAEATRVAAEAAIHHIQAEAEALAEEDFHQAEVLAEDARQAEDIITAEEAEDALMEDHRQDTADITVRHHHHRHHHHTEEADITDARQEEVPDVMWERFWLQL